MTERKEIVALLRKHYIRFSPAKWERFERGGGRTRSRQRQPERSRAKGIQPTDETLAADFAKAWGREHGGYISPAELKGLLSVGRGGGVFAALPHARGNTLVLTEMPFNGKAAQKKYIQRANSALLAMGPFLSASAPLILDLRGNSGGKPEVMMAALLPIFNAFDREVLTLVSGRGPGGGLHVDITTARGSVTSAYNGGHTAHGTTRRLKGLDSVHVLLDGGTASAAEQVIIALLTLPIQVTLEGPRTAGFTTVIQWFPLAAGSGVEVPVGYMANVNGKLYKRGIRGRQ